MRGLIRNSMTFWQSPHRVLALAAALGVALTALYGVFSYGMFRDVAGCYALMVRQFGAGDPTAALHPALPPLNMVLAGLLCRAGVEAYTATIIVSGFFYVAALGPLYGLLRRWLTPTQAAWGGMLYILAPKVIRFSCTGLLESSRTFFVVAGLELLLRCAEGRRRRDRVLFAAVLAGLALARGEGAVLAAFLLAACGVVAWRRRPRELPRIAAMLLAVGALTLVLLAPRLIQNYRATGYPVLDLRMADVAARVTGNLRPVPAPAPDAYLLPGEVRSPLPERLGKSLGHFLRGAYEPYCLLALVGLFGLWRRRCWREIDTLVAGMGVLQIAIFTLVVSSYRYYTVMVPLMLVWSVPGLCRLLELVRRYGGDRGRAAALALLAAAALGQLWNGVEPLFDRGDRRLYCAGRWIAEHRAEWDDGRTGPLRILRGRCHDVAYWSGALAAPPYGAAAVDWRRFAEFDAAVLSAGKEQALAEVLLARPDIRPVPQPYDEIILLKRVEAETENR